MFEYQDFEPDPRITAWFKREQGRFLKRARLRAGLSVRDVALRTGVDIRWVESGEINLEMRNLIFFVHLYRVPEDYFRTWQEFIGIKLRQLSSPKSQ